MSVEIPNQADIEERWRHLDPIFIMGRQRSGTSIMWRALRALDFLGFPEGHLWFDLVESFARYRDPSYQQNVRQDIFTLGSQRNALLERRFAVMIDQFHRDLLGAKTVRWVDKSPGLDPVLLAPMLAELFPNAQLIFMLRNPIMVVNSSVHYIRGDRETPVTVAEKKASNDLYRATCQHWVRVMETWRQIRHLLQGRYLEIAQEQIVMTPDEVADQVAKFLDVPQSTGRIANVFKSRRENTAFPEKEVGDFFYPVDWSEEKKTILTEICQKEMEIWGYPLDFQLPAGPQTRKIEIPHTAPPDMSAYFTHWLGRHKELESERQLAACKEQLARIEQGRVMRTLNQLSRFLRRLGART